MKKIIVLILMLWTAAGANAGVIDMRITSINGVAISPVSEIRPRPSDVIGLSIVWEGITGRYMFGLSSIFQYRDNAPISWDFVHITRNPAFDLTLQRTDLLNGHPWIVEAASFYGVPGVTGQAQTLVSNILVHMDGQDIIKIKLLDYAGGGGSMEVDADFNMFVPTYGAGVIINQVPEPMTLMLLGLGSLFLARRKK